MADKVNLECSNLLGIKKDPCRLAREGKFRATLRLFSKQTAVNATVKVNLISVSIAG